MKNLSKLILAFALIFGGINTATAQSSLKVDKAKRATEVKNLVSNKDYVFEATYTKGEKPLKYHKYDVAITKDTLIANLPGNNGPVKIASTDFAYNSMEGKRGSWDIVIKPKAGLTSNVKQLKIDITPQGHASLHVIRRSQGPLALDGYIKQEDY
jgi:hypothetical protein